MEALPLVVPMCALFAFALSILIGMSGIEFYLILQPLTIVADIYAGSGPQNGCNFQLTSETQEAHEELNA